MTEAIIRIQGRAGRITLNRPAALNSATYGMLQSIDATLDTWRDDPTVELVLIDAAGDKAFCAGGDIADLYAAGRVGDFAFGRTFWEFEYRLNAKIATYPKPIVSFMQGFTMGGGVGLGCHASTRIVCESSQIAMPECGIGLVPDVGGSLLLAQAPGHMGEYLGLTGARMGAADAITAGFADHFVPLDAWEALKQDLIEKANVAAIDAASSTPENGTLNAMQPEIDACFAADSLMDIADRLRGEPSEFAAKTLKSLERNSPLSMASALLLIRSVRDSPSIQEALSQEFRFTARASEKGDFLEGIRAAIIDKDRTPTWRHRINNVTVAEASAMLAPLGADDLTWET